MSAIQTTFTGEMQLAGWRESHTSGAIVSFWLPDSGDLEVFKGLTARKGNIAGHRMMAVLVEIGNDEQPITETSPEMHRFITESSPEDHIAEAGKKIKGGPLAKLAGMWSSDRQFWEWINSPMTGNWTAFSEDEAADFIRCICMIESRAELDHDPAATRLFNEQIRIPFMAWKDAK